jgi:isocitrate dehydrogenase
VLQNFADTPEAFDVIVMPNLYGDILSDVAAQISGSVGLAGSANIGDKGAMFEAIHGSAPRRAGQNMANPSGLLLAAVMMLVHLGETRLAERIHNAWLKTLEQGIHTYDIYTEGVSKRKVGTKEFAQAVVKFLGERPEQLKAASYQENKKITPIKTEHFHSQAHRELVGTDIFIYHRHDAKKVIDEASKITSTSPLKLQMITNRGVRIWPNGHPETSCIEQWRLRFSHREKPKSFHQGHHSIDGRFSKRGI